MHATRKTIKRIIDGGATWLLWMQNKIAKVMSAVPAIRYQVSTARWINSVLGIQQIRPGKCHNQSWARDQTVRYLIKLAIHWNSVR